MVVVSFPVVGRVVALSPFQQGFAIWLVASGGGTVMLDTPCVMVMVRAALLTSPGPLVLVMAPVVVVPSDIFGSAMVELVDTTEPLAEGKGTSHWEGISDPGKKDR